MERQGIDMRTRRQRSAGWGELIGSDPLLPSSNFPNVKQVPVECFLEWFAVFIKVHDGRIEFANCLWRAFTPNHNGGTEAEEIEQQKERGQPEQGPTRTRGGARLFGLGRHGTNVTCSVFRR